MSAMRSVSDLIRSMVDSSILGIFSAFGSGLEPKDLPRYRFHEAPGRLARVLVWSAVDFLAGRSLLAFFARFRGWAKTRQVLTRFSECFLVIGSRYNERANPINTYLPNV
jgi:hypothetical protein